jgi:hypothetical protein
MPVVWVDLRRSRCNAATRICAVNQDSVRLDGGLLA